MVNMEQQLMAMMANGADYDTLRATLDKMEAEAKAKQDSILIEARETMVDAAIKYLVALGVITEAEIAEMDMTPIMQSIEEGEKEIKDVLATITKLGGFFDSNPNPKPRVVKVRPIETPMDAEKVIKDFVTKLEGLK